MITDNAIFVSPDGCNINGDGTIDRPYQSLDHAQSVVAPGQTVYFREGTYKIELTDLGVIYSKGKPDAWITFTNYNNEKVVFDGGGKSMLISSFNSLITLYNAQYVIFDGFEVCNLWGHGITNFDTFHTIIRNCTVRNFHGRGIGGHGQHNTYEFNEIYHNSMANEGAPEPGYWSSGLATINRPGFILSSNIIIRNNKIYENWGEGINVFLATNVLVENNEVFDNYSVNIHCGTSTSVTIQSNLISAKDNKFYRFDGPTTGIQIANVGSQTAVRVKPYECVEHILIKGNTIDGASDGIAYWEDKRNICSTNTYRHITICENNFTDIWDYDIHVNRVSVPNAAPPQKSKIIDNKLSRPVNHFLIGNPEAWEVKGNTFRGDND